MIVQLCGLSGAGKTTLTQHVRNKLLDAGVKVEVIDGDEYRRRLCRDLGFSREDRLENIRRLAFIASRFSHHGIVAIISAINPYEELRAEIRQAYPDVNTVWIECPLEVLISRDTKGLYKRALLPEEDPDKLRNLTGVNDPFDVPQNPDLVIHTGADSLADSVSKLADFIISRLPAKDLPSAHPSPVSYEK